ncbi:hypothetical protein JB92DRAFT_3115412 [Gautieria morchelliformis]|nr:hypothetical protein JB92DRAFT_3115412 [Gautieria morchelliformis]
MAKVCKTKWTHLKQDYQMANQLKSLSSYSFDEQSGVNAAVDDVKWQSYLAAHPKHATIAAKGFPLYEAMGPLMLSLAWGKHAYHPTNGSSGSTHDSEILMDVDHRGEMPPPPILGSNQDVPGHASGINVSASTSGLGP